MPGRILGVDYGTKRIGLAISDETATIARPYRTLEAGPEVVEQLLRLVSEEKVSTVVVGLPRSLSGGASPATEEAAAFAERLRAEAPAGVGVELWDERLTTRQALREMREAGLDERHARPSVDMVSACIMLQSYLDSRPRTGGA